MASVRSERGSNLYSIDLEVLRSVLIEANESLARRQQALLAEAALLNEAPDQRATALKLAKSMKRLLSDLRVARQWDNRPFKRATDLIKAHFTEIEKPLKAKLDALKELLGSLAETSSGSQEILAVSRHGEPIIEVTTRVAEITTGWEIASVDRRTVNLESLRHFLTDHELRRLCTRRLAKHGPHQLEGVVYAKVPIIR